MSERWPSHNSSDSVATLVTTALGQRSLSGLSEMLKVLTETAGAYGCILWQVVPGTTLNPPDAEGRLFVLAEWLPGEHPLVMHNLPLHRSVIGEAVLGKKSLCIADAQNDERVYKDNSWILHANIQTMCVVPVLFRDGARGAIALYRNQPVQFTDEEVVQVEQLSLLISDLYQAIRDRVSQDLLRKITDTLQDADLQATVTTFDKTGMKKVFEQVCRVVSNTFQCVETSLFLEDPSHAADEYKLMATTWPDHIPRWKETYYASETEGATGWALLHRKSVRIFDLAHFTKDKTIIQRAYPGLEWKDGWNIKEAYRQELNVETVADMQPLSFMAVPICRGEKVLGVIRCCTARKGPYYFAEPELGLLDLVAAQISRFWNNWLTQRELENEKQAWRSLLEKIRQLNSFVQKEISRNDPNEQRILSETLKATSSAIGNCDRIGVRWYDPGKKDLYVAETLGNGWDKGTAKQREKWRNRRFIISDPPTSAGAYVFTQKKIYLVQDVENDAYYAKDKIPGTKRAIIAPIIVGSQIFGVLDIRRKVGTPLFPDYAASMADIIGQHLGLYHYLITTIIELRETQKKLQQQAIQQTLTYEDLAHQLKSPINLAYARAQAILSESPSHFQLMTNVKAIRSFCRKARRVTLSMSLFASSANDQSIDLVVSRLSYNSLMELLDEAVPDNEFLIDPRRQIKFSVNRESFQVLYDKQVKVDRDLLEQAINNLLDNAGKYSYPNTKVEIFGGLTKQNEFYFAISNEGLLIRPEEVRKATERGWRSDQARWSTGEGSGIGLWIVDYIMQVHRGRLEIIPTTNKGITQVRLLFK